MRATQDIPFTWIVFSEMNHRETPQIPAATRRAFFCLSLMLSMAMTPKGAHALPRLRLAAAGTTTWAGQRPYLLVTGSIPLRIQPAPTRLAPTPDEAAASPSNVAAADASAAAPSNVAPAESTPMAINLTGEEKPAAPATAPAKTPAPILSDDARPTVRPEDFIPYFQIPGSARHPSDVTLLIPAPKAPPAPASLPPSSATYTQTPR
jgi:hypothetical protein